MNKKKEIFKGQRQLNYEILRIVAMLMIVCLHYLGKSEILGEPSRSDMTTNAYFAWIIEAFCLVAVNVYVLISGYFGSVKNAKTEDKPAWNIIKKSVIIWKQVLFYSLAIGMFSILTGITKFDKYVFISYIAPIVTEHYWFATSYIFLSMLMPFLNEGIHRLEKKELEVLILSMLLFFSISKTVIPMHLPWDKYGYDVLWLTVLYLTGAYVKKYGSEFINTRIKAIMVYVLSQAIIFLSFVLLRQVYLNTGSFKDLINYGYSYNYIFCYTGAIGLFLAFGSFKTNKTDNENKALITGKLRTGIELFSKATFGVYLIHEHIAVRGLWVRLVDSERLLNSSLPVFFMNMIFTVLMVYLICSIIEIIRIYLAGFVRKLFKKK